MKITIDPFDPKSVDAALAQLEQYKKDFLEKEKEFVKRLAEIGVSVASEVFATADYDGENDVKVRLEADGTRAAVIAEGEAVGFIEFGTGIRNPEWDDSGMDFTPPKHGTFGKGHGARPKGWFYYPKEGEPARRSFGNPPAEAMRTARDTILEQITQIASEVWI